MKSGRLFKYRLSIVRKFLKDKEIILDIDDEAKDWLAKLGYDVTYGARPLKRTIQKYLTNPLSQELLMGSLTGLGSEINSE